jgi:hypothetical protein
MTIYKGTPTRLSADFSIGTLQARREWNNMLKMMKGKNLQPRIFYPGRFLFRFDGEIKILKEQFCHIASRQAKFKKI